LGQQEKVGIVTDSTCDLPEDLVAEHQIHVLPTHIIIGDQSFEDGRGISRQAFYDQLPQMVPPPKTAAPSSGAFHELYEKLLTSGINEVISIHTSATLSGIYNAARLASRQFVERIHVVDSHQTSMGLGFQVLEAARMASQGVPLKSILQCIHEIRSRVRVIAMLDTLTYLRRSGRVSWARAQIGSLLNIKPFIELYQGVVSIIGRVRTKRAGVQHLKQLLSDFGPLEHLAMLHTDAEEEVNQLVTEINPQVRTRILTIYVTTVIGSHVGPRGLGFAAVPGNS
jgi:DegV family protein with EDD domain